MLRGDLHVWISAGAATVRLLRAGDHERVRDGVAVRARSSLAAHGRLRLAAPDARRTAGAAAAALVPVLLLAPSRRGAGAARRGLPYLVGAACVLGFAILGVLASSPAHDLRDLARAVLGITNVAAAPTSSSSSRAVEHPAEGAPGEQLLPYFAAWAIGAVGLSIYGYVASGRAVSKPAYRLVEALGLLFSSSASATVLSLVNVAEDAFFPALVFVAGRGGARLLALWTRRASLLVGAAIALLVNLSLQYFVRLQHLLPTAALIIGFGVVLLGLGLAYERRLKRLLPLLKAWR